MQLEIKSSAFSRYNAVSKSVDLDLFHQTLKFRFKMAAFRSAKEQTKDCDLMRSEFYARFIEYSQNLG